MRVFAVPLLFACCLAISDHVEALFPFQNTSLSIEDRVKDIVDNLTLEELVEQMAHGGATLNGPAPGIPRLHINPYQWGTECLSGNVSAGDATSFPMPIGMAASFNYDLLKRVTNATAYEVRAKHAAAVKDGSYAFHTGLSCWSPVLNIMRDPRWGRNQETYGEDPYLSGYLGQAYVNGLQGNNSRYIIANAGCKHFDVHGGPENIPTSRFSFDAKVSMRDWRMTFLPQFKACVEAGALSLMCSYNRINGVPACANKALLTDILRNEWDFKGYVVSDQGALEFIVIEHHYAPDFMKAAADAANAGTCLEDGNIGRKFFNVFEHLVDAVKNNLVSVDTLKNAVSRLFYVRMKLGEFDPPDNNPYANIPLSVIQSDAHINLSLQAAMESIVLMKNDDGFRSPFLPITNEVKKACMVGPFSDDPEVLFGDYSPTLMRDYVITSLAGLKNANIGTDTLNYAVGCEDGPACRNYDSAKVRSACDGVELIIVTAGLSKHLESEGKDLSDINLPGHQLDLMQDAEAASKNASVILILFNASPLDIRYAKTDPRIVGILEAYYPGQTAGKAIANVLTGEYNPSGRLPNTWPASLDQVPGITNYTMKERTYRYFTQEPLYPFGYGLSYTTFHYSNLNISSTATASGAGMIAVSVLVTNTGSMDGTEVTQVYVWCNISYAPKLQLVGVNKDFISKGKTLEVSFSIKPEQLQVWTDDDKWVIPVSTYDLSVSGQQPNQTVLASSNVLKGSFKIQ
ncbi:PREDICTED: uncharacterized protein LOC100638070 isoform X2 [Amphimedon queenslandica]|uniref:Fibronectin type III-like domain-containing protein n=1 Tax=Amphimedon queenslandica TaxID=400682 RepID=A0A1X7VU49_AMPQE|nr:PREDICTED: uncharacterized protein LOC100638070 isoform X1 [Amphimedon queenslandica]XP_019862212.1 PREDICTED: uncharacterized protein LOC100638070 isoform X2 [Amphimedon queenslandica]|eukprot:XP_019862172.1 PREDICTED: uncharacterized protein LOC100638070 isoform X1 [Amphimedon queenslandica]